MATAAIPVKYADTITECPLCSRIVTDPIVFPCIHSFCRRCIEGLVENRRPVRQVRAVLALPPDEKKNEPQLVVPESADTEKPPETASQDKDAAKPSEEKVEDLKPATVEETEIPEELPKDVKLPCPLCNKHVTIAFDGSTKLTRNCFLQKLVEVKHISGKLARGDVNCDVCIDDQGRQTGTFKKSKGRSVGEETAEGSQAQKAAQYCIQCRTSMCDVCHGHHRKFTFETDHKIIDADGKHGEDELLRLLPETLCTIHAGKPVELFCRDCRVAVCMICCVRNHKTHDCADVGEVKAELDGKLKIDDDSVDTKIAECRQMLNELAGTENEFLETVRQTETEVIGKCEAMKKQIEDHKAKLLAELDAARVIQVGKTQVARQEVEERLKMLNNFKKYLDEIRAKGMACDVAKASSGLRERTKQLSGFDVYNDLEAERTKVDVKFLSEMEMDNLQKIFGNLLIKVSIIEGNYMSMVKPLKVVPTTSQSVTGIATLGKEVFVTRWGVRHIEVYDTDSMTPQRQLQLSASHTTTQNRGIAVCSINNCIYVSDPNNKCIHKADIEGKALNPSMWSVGAGTYGLSVNAEHNVLVACYDSNEIREYTTAGSLVRQISLKSNITNPVHVIQLVEAAGHYGILHHGSMHRYCVVDAEGQVVKSFGAASGSGDGQLSSPHGLAISSRGYAFIANQGSNIVRILEPEKLEAKQLVIDGSLGGPYCIHLDPASGRMYIGEWGNGRILVMGR